MTLRSALAIGVAAALCSVPLTAVAQSETVDIGDRDSVVELFSWPNCVTNCSTNRSLTETVEFYLRSSLRRDGLSSTVVDATESAGRVKVKFSGPAAVEYSKLLPIFLQAGSLGAQASREIKAAGGWLPNWRFFLPLGLAMANNPTVQLLHFPPDYVLTKTQDYLDANTTRRWAEMLEMNGAKSGDTDRFQAIVDIAPIAAPANDGAKLDGVYGKYTPYSNGMLKFWLIDQQTSARRPMVAFGAPVRDWIKANYGVTLKVGDTANIPIPNVGSIAVIAANHPSMIYRSASSYEGPDGKPSEKGVSRIAGVMFQDALAACWQVEMGRSPNADEGTVAAKCTAKWAPKKLELCKAGLKQVYNMDSAEQQLRCKPVLQPGAEVLGIDALDQLERSLKL